VAHEAWSLAMRENADYTARSFDGIYQRLTGRA